MAKGPLPVSVARSIAVLSVARHRKRIPARYRKTPHLRCSRKPLRSQRWGGQRLLVAAVAVVDGNLEEPGAGHTTTGRRRSLVLLKPGLQRLNQAQVRGRQWWRCSCPPGCNPVSTRQPTLIERTNLLSSSARVCSVPHIAGAGVCSCIYRTRSVDRVNVLTQHVFMPGAKPCGNT